jgi:SPP1 gp7 family putative phage head morphogenesis protein
MRVYGTNVTVTFNGVLVPHFDRAAEAALNAQLQRAFRKRVMQAAATRHPKTVPRGKPPTGIQLAYTAILVGMSREMDRAIMSVLADRGIVRRDAEGDAPNVTAGDIKQIAAQISRRLGAITSRASLVGAISRIATRAVAFSRQQWQAQLKATLGINLAADPDLSKLLDRFRREQGDLITSLAEDKVQRVKRVLTDAGSDARVEQIQARIVEQTGATESRASLIARTETTTLNSRLTEARHRAAGITEFTWSTSKDERVRPSHAAMEGRRFEYASPPVVDGEPLVPGQTYNCRCIPIPFIPGFDEAT